MQYFDVGVQLAVFLVSILNNVFIMPREAT